MLTSQYKCYTVAPAPSPSPALQTLRTLQLANGSLIHFCRGSVLGFEGDALVNAANEGGVEGGGVDGAVNAAGGPELKRARSQLPLVAADVRIPTGSARSTPAFGSLKVRHVIHAVGPDYCALDAAQYARADLQLQSAYVAAVDAARHLKLRTIGSCLLSAGVYLGGQSLERATYLGVAAVASSLGPGSEFSFAGFTEAESRGLCDLADAACEDRRSSAVGLFKRLLCVRSVSGDGPALGTYREMARVLVRECEELGLQVRCREFVAGKPVVLASWPGSEPALEAVLFTSHYDVVPAEQAKWTVDAWSGLEVGGRVYGRGAQDMKCVLAAQLAAIRGAKARGITLKRTLHLSFLPDEEIGGVDGMLALIASEEFKSLGRIGIAIDEGLANEQDAYTVFYGERSPLWVLVTSTGPTGHGSRFIQDTAVEKLVKFAGRAFEFRRSEEAAFVGKAGGGHVAGCAHASAKKLGEVTTLNVTFLKAGVMMQQEPQQAGSEDRVSLNVVPTEARAGLDLRVPPSVPIAAVTDLLDAWCREAGDTSWKFAPWTQPVEAHFTSSTDRTDKFWAAFQDALGATGVRVELEVFPAGTDSRFLRQVGVQAFGFSPIRNTPILLHEHDEWLGVHTLVEGVAVYERLLQALCVDLL